VLALKRGQSHPPVAAAPARGHAAWRHDSSDRVISPFEASGRLFPGRAPSVGLRPPFSPRPGNLLTLIVADAQHPKPFRRIDADSGRHRQWSLDQAREPSIVRHMGVVQIRETPKLRSPFAIRALSNPVLSGNGTLDAADRNREGTSTQVHIVSQHVSRKRGEVGNAEHAHMEAAGIQHAHGKDKAL